MRDLCTHKALKPSYIKDANISQTTLSPPKPNSHSHASHVPDTSNFAETEVWKMTHIFSSSTHLVIISGDRNGNMEAGLLPTVFRAPNLVCHSIHRKYLKISHFTLFYGAPEMCVNPWLILFGAFCRLLGNPHESQSRRREELGLSFKRFSCLKSKLVKNDSSQRRFVQT